MRRSFQEKKVGIMQDFWKQKGQLAEIGDAPTDSIVCDLYDEDQVAELIAIISDEKRHIRGLVNAAGCFAPKPFLDQTRDDYRKYLDLNESPFFITQAAARNMKRNGGGAIVNSGSMWAKQAVKATPSS